MGAVLRVSPEIIKTASRNRANAIKISSRSATRPVFGSRVAM